MFQNPGDRSSQYSAGYKFTMNGSCRDVKAVATGAQTGPPGAARAQPASGPSPAGATRAAPSSGPNS